MTRRRSRPMTELVAYLDAQLADVRAELARTQAELEEYRQADAFGWEIVNERRAARDRAAKDAMRAEVAQAAVDADRDADNYRAELAQEGADAEAVFAASGIGTTTAPKLALASANGHPTDQRNGKSANDSF